MRVAKNHKSGEITVWAHSCVSSSQRGRWKYPAAHSGRCPPHFQSWWSDLLEMFMMTALITEEPRGNGKRLKYVDKIIVDPWTLNTTIDRSCPLSAPFLLKWLMKLYLSFFMQTVMVYIQFNKQPDMFPNSSKVKDSTCNLYLNSIWKIYLKLKL